MKKENLKEGAKEKISLVKVHSKKLYSSYPKLSLATLAIIVASLGFIYFKNNESKKESYIVARGKIEEAVSVTGKIKASTDAELSFEKGGLVSAVYVKEGQKVRAGQTLVALSGGTDYGQVLEARAGVSSAQAQLDLLKSGTRSEAINVGQAGVSSAEAQLSASYSNIDTVFKNAYSTTNDVVLYKTQNFFIGSYSTGYRTSVTTCNSSLENQVAMQRKIVEDDLKNWSKIDIGSLTNDQKESALSSARKYLSDTQTMLDLMSSIVNASCVSSDSSFDNYRNTVSSAKTALIQAESNIVQAQNTLASSKSAVNTAKSNLNLTSANTEPEKIKQAEATLRSAYARLYQAQAAASKNVIVAPGNGVVTKVDISKGEYASPGKPVLRIIGTGEYTVEADVTESDIARIILDNEATVVIPAIDSKETFVGKVVSIDPAEQSDEGNPLYRIVISLDSKDARIKSGMTADTTIVTNMVDNIVRIPTRFLTKVKGISKVQVVIDDKTLESEEREIKTGRKSTDGYVEILSGVEEGEILVLPSAAK